MNQTVSFGDWLRQRRRARDWTQEELAKQSGCAVGTIRKIEADELRPSKQLAEILAQRLDVPPQDQENFVRFARGVGRDISTAPTFIQPTPIFAPVQRDVTPTHNLPSQLTNFIGREREIDQVRQFITTTRLLTLTGAGGTGKTRLALEAATKMLKDFSDGVWFVELAPLADSSLVIQSIAATFGLREREGDTLDTLLKNYLRAKKLLIVLDNCEHLIGACAQFADAFLRACPHLKILATSREAMGVTGETTFRVPSLEIPNPETKIPLDDISRYDSIRLFADRAKLVQPSFAITPHSAPAIAEICYRLDGIPLAIELAAARIKGMTAEQIAERLDDRFQLLTIGGRTALPRQQTLRATMDWSYSLLSETERKLLGRLSVFAGSWSLEGAEAVCSGNGIEMNDVLDLLLRLIDKSLVLANEETENQVARYRMLETIRQYAQEKLLTSNESERVCDCHLDFCLKLAEEAELKVITADQMIWLKRLESEHDNLRAAMEWSLEHADADNAARAMRLIGAQIWFWLIRGYVNEARNWLERSLENRTRSPARAKPLLGLGIFEFFTGSLARCRALCAEGLALFQEQEDKRGAVLSMIFCAAAASDPSNAGELFEQGRSLAKELKDAWLSAGTDILQGGYVRRRGDPARARQFFESAVDHARRSGDRWMIGNALENLGLAAIDQGDDEQAKRFLTESLPLHREMGDKHQLANDLYGLGIIATRRSERGEASALLKQALALQIDIGDTRAAPETLSALGNAAVMEQQYARAARLFGAAQGAGEKLDAQLPSTHRNENESQLAAARAQLDAATFNAAWNQGRAMTMEQTIEYALGDE